MSVVSGHTVGWGCLAVFGHCYHVSLFLETRFYSGSCCPPQESKAKSQDIVVESPLALLERIVQDEEEKDGEWASGCRDPWS